MASKPDGTARRVLPKTVFYKSFCKIDINQADYYPDWYYPESSAVEAIIGQFRSEFPVDLEDVKFSDCGGFNLIPFDDSVCGFFNRDLARSMAEAKWAMDSKQVSVYQKLYHLESAIARHCACWEFLFQIIAVHLQLEDSFYATRDGMRQLLGQAVYDEELIPIQNGYRSKYHGKSHSESMAVIKELRKRFDFMNPRFNAKAFFKHMSKHHGFSGWLDGVKKLFRDSSSGKIREHRNTLSHVHSLSSVAFVDDRHHYPAPRTALNFHEIRATDIKKMWETLLRAHRNLASAVLIARIAIYSSDHPNSKRNEDVQFSVRQLKCSRCEVATFVPIPEAFPGIDERIYCQNCGWWPKEDEYTDLNNVIHINEVVWGSLVNDRINSMTGREDLLRASLEDSAPGG